MKQYIDLIERIQNEGVEKTDRTGVGTLSIFGHQSVYDLAQGFPLLTLKDTHFPSIVHELLWFINAVPQEYKKFGNTNIKYLVDNKVNIWNEWALKDYLIAHNKNIKNDPENSDWISEMKKFVFNIKNDEDFAEKWGGLGTVYGKQWTSWSSYKKDNNPPYLFEEREINQLQILVEKLKKQPDDRGLIVSAWNVAELDNMALRPCHTMWQLNTHNATDSEIIKIAKRRYIDWIGLTILDENDLKEELSKTEKLFKHWWESGAHQLHGNNFRALPIFIGIPKLTLDLQLYQRSGDSFLGIPYNIASYSLLLCMIAQVTNMIPGKFIHTLGDAHLYKNHLIQSKELLDRVGCGCGGTEKNYGPALPIIELNPLIKNLEDFRFEDIKLIGYNPLSKIKAPIAI